jgi:hypothetical protein
MVQLQALLALLRNYKEMTMDKVTFIEDANGAEHALIDHGNGEFTSMSKERYEELEAAKANANEL